MLQKSAKILSLEKKFDLLLFFPTTNHVQSNMMLNVTIIFREDINSNIIIVLKPTNSINYIRTINCCYSVESRQQGVTVVVDAQRSSWRLVRPVTRQVSQVLGSSLATLLVLRPDAFWDKQRVDNCARVHKEGEVLSHIAYCCIIYIYFIKK